MRLLPKISEPMKKHLIYLLFAILFVSVIESSAQKRRNRYVTGDLRIHNFESTIFGNKRKIRVFLPEGYRRSKRDYPVLYLNDGQNLFDPASSQAGGLEWGVDETVLSLLRLRRIEPLIVVGIDNAGKSLRANEYLPWEDTYLTPPLKNPNGAKYPDFVTQEVMPFVEKKYRIKRGAEFTGIGGSSYGALISLYTVLQKPEFFGRVLLESPSFYVDDARVLKMSETTAQFPAKVYLGVGTNETGKKNCDLTDESHEAVTDVRRLESILKGKTALKVFVEPCAVHNEAAYGRRFATALEFLYPRLP